MDEGDVLEVADRYNNSKSQDRFVHLLNDLNDRWLHHRADLPGDEFVVA